MKEAVKYTEADVDRLNEQLGGKPAEEIVRWAAETFGGDIKFANSFGAEDVVMMDLIAKAGPHRAAWVAKALTPLNPQAQPGSPLPEEAPLPIAPAFPKVDTKGDTWTRPALARVLPDRWAAMGYRNGAKVGTWWGNTVPDSLPVSLDPNVIQVEIR